MYIKKKIGKYGEDISVKYLEENNYKILERNFNSYYGEIDIIAKEKNEIIFIEVKSRRNFKYGRPIEAVNNIKIKHIKNTAMYYLVKTKSENANIRFDVIEVYISKKETIIKHFKQVI